MFNSFYGETLKAYQNWAAGTFATLRSGDTSLRSTSRSPVVTDRVRDYLLHLAVESPAGKYQALWPYQREAILRAIFTHGLLQPRDAGWKDLLLNVVTGGGSCCVLYRIVCLVDFDVGSLTWRGAS
jgi:hypothetical protein